MAKLPVLKFDIETNTKINYKKFNQLTNCSMVLTFMRASKSHDDKFMFDTKLIHQRIITQIKQNKPKGLAFIGRAMCAGTTLKMLNTIDYARVEKILATAKDTKFNTFNEGSKIMHDHRREYLQYITKKYSLTPNEKEKETLAFEKRKLNKRLNKITNLLNNPKTKFSLSNKLLVERCGIVSKLNAIRIKQGK